MSAEAKKIRVLAVDDHPLVRQGIAGLLATQPDMTMVAEAANGREAIQQFRAHRPDVTLMDLQMPEVNGLDAIIAIRGEFPEARIIILTTYTGDVHVMRAMKAGAQGYLVKSTPPRQMLDTIRQVHGGRKAVAREVADELATHMGEESLSNREVEVLRHVAEGNRNRDIAKRLFIAEETVKVHLKHIMGKLGASDRTQSVAIAARRGIIYL